MTYAGSPNKYLPQGVSRPNITTSIANAYVPNWDLGPNQYPVQAQNPYLNASSFAYPAAFTVGNLGRNTFESPGLNWTQISISKWFRIKERYRLQARLDGYNMPIKQPNFGAPNGSFNTSSLGTFGRIGAPNVRGAFSNIGTAESNWQLVGRFEF